MLAPPGNLTQLSKYLGWLLCLLGTSHHDIGAQPIPQGPTPVRTVVLKNGNVFRGELHRSRTQITVSHDGTLLQLPRDEVELIANDLIDAYQRKSTSVSKVNGRQQLDLIRWCLRQGLIEQARAELKTFQRRHPNHSQMAAITKQVLRFQPAIQGTILPSNAPLHPDQQIVDDQGENLSTDTMYAFVRHVQPLMVNRCGLAKCHGPASTNSFSLVRSPWSTFPLGITKRNLGSTLRQIGDHPPQQTSLWMSANSVHGSLTSRAMQPRELATLWAWLERIGGELNGEPAALVARRASSPTLGPGDNGSDPFDPDEFNQRNRPPEPVVGTDEIQSSDEFVD